MLLDAAQFATLLQALGLGTGLFKPIPGLIGSVNDTVHGIVSTVNQTTAGLGSPLPGLPPLPIVGILQTDQKLVNLAKGSKSKEKVSAMNLDDPQCQVIPYNAPVPEPHFTPFDYVNANIFRYRQQQSVNLGSWFVHENWMSPSVSACANGTRQSELDVAMGWGSQENARAVLEKHWDTWITRADFQHLSSIGINTVRLPIGYWSLGPQWCKGTDFEPVANVYQNSWPRVLRAIQWASEFSIGVLIDLHGAPGSQNGQSHSGISDGRANLFKDPFNMRKTTDILVFLTQQLSAVTNVIGIQLLNEPVNDPGLEAFYDQAITAMRAVSPQAATLPLYVHDGFNLQQFSDYVSNRSDFVVQDHHSYFVFTPQDSAKPAKQHTSDIATGTNRSLSHASVHERRNLIIGEWSCALTDESLANEDDRDEARRQFCTGQMEVYTNTTAGWAFWSYRLESRDKGWSFETAVGKSLPSTFFSYGVNAPPGSSNILLLASIIANMNTPSPVRRSSEHTHWHHPATTHRRQLRDPSVRGYSDGFLTAKIFAAHGLSKLGFVDQYVYDSIAVLGPELIPPGTEGSYREGFVKGLRDAEGIVRAAVPA